MARRHHTSMLVDGMTAANDLELTDAVPARVIYHTNGRYQPLRIGPLTIEFRPIAKRRLYWAGRPAMRVVQALYWLKDLQDLDQTLFGLRTVLADPEHGRAIVEDLRAGMDRLPQWMRRILCELIG